MEGRKMLKPTLEFIKPFVVKYPSISILIVIMLSILWGYNDLRATKVDREEFEQVKQKVNDMDGKVDGIITEQKNMAKYFTGNESFAPVAIMPPQEYLVGIDTELLRNPFDSCLQGRVPDAETGKPPYYCWCTDSIGTQKVVTFNYSR